MQDRSFAATAMSMMRGTLLLCCLVLPLAGQAHHAIAGNYDAKTVIEVEGEVTGVLWRNPHVQISLRSVDAQGKVEDWDMATTALSNIRRWQIDPNFIEVGDRIRVAGNPTVRGKRGLYISNVLTQGGAEVLLGATVKPRWSERTVEMTASRRRGIGDASAPELGIFRVWSTPDTIPMLIPRNFGKLPDYRAKLTPAARAAVDAFVWTRDTPLRECKPKGMPTIMEAPYPFELVRDGDNILWHVEEYDTVRTIHMGADASAAGQQDSLLGYSVGHWEDDHTLVVTTTHMGWGHFDGLGVPMSRAASLVERFTLSPQGDRLDYSMTFSDPENFAEPVTLGKHWVWYPDASVGKYECSLAAED